MTHQDLDQDLLQEKKRFEYLFKVILMGDSGTGKTCLLNRFVDDTFNDNTLLTIGIDFKTRVLSSKGKAVKLQIWDTAGKHKYESLSELFYRGVMGVVYCFDLTNKASFNNIDKWIKKLTSSPHYDGSANIRSFIVGCKSDLTQERQVTSSKGQQLAIRLGAHYYEVSAKNGQNVDKMFIELSQGILNNFLDWISEPKSNGGGVAVANEVSEPDQKHPHRASFVRGIRRSGDIIRSSLRVSRSSSRKRDRVKSSLLSPTNRLSEVEPPAMRKCYSEAYLDSKDFAERNSQRFSKKSKKRFEAGHQSCCVVS